MSAPRGPLQSGVNAASRLTVRHCRFERKPAEPPVGEVEPGLIAQSPHGTDRIAVADQQHPDHQLRIGRRSADLAVERLELLMDHIEVEQRIQLTQQMVRRNLVLEPENCRTGAPDQLPIDPSSPDPIAIDPTATAPARLFSSLAQQRAARSSRIRACRHPPQGSGESLVRGLRSLALPLGTSGWYAVGASKFTSL